MEYGEMIMPSSGERRYDLRYYAEQLSQAMPPCRSLIRSRTIDGAKKEAERRFPLNASGDILRILGVIRSGTCQNNHLVTIAETVFPKSYWAESDEAQWFRMVEGEAELADGFASPDEEPPAPHAKIHSIAEALGVSVYHLATFLPDYGDVIAAMSRPEVMSIADAAHYLNVKKCRVDQLRMKGRLGVVVRFAGRRFLRRESVEAFAEKRRRDIAEFWERVRQIEAEEQRRRSS